MNYCLICFTATAAIDVSTGNFKTNVIQGAIAVRLLSKLLTGKHNSIVK